jgi:DNA-binding XRE family transcriptional regulator
MVRERLTVEEIERGRHLGRVLRTARGTKTAVDVAATAGVSVETVRKIEHGLVPTPAFFTVLALASACEVTLDALAHEIHASETAVAMFRRPAGTVSCQ